MLITPGYRPVTPALLQEWLKLQAEFTVAVENAVEQTAQLRWAMAALQCFLDTPRTLVEPRAAREELDWAVYWRDETLDYAFYIEKKLNILCALDNLIRVCNSF